MIRVVLDTNVVVSAMLRSGGLPEAVFNVAMAREVQMYVSVAILAEYNEVLRRPRRDIRPEKIVSALANIREAARMVHPVARVTAASDRMTICFSNVPMLRRPITSSRGMPGISRRRGWVPRFCHHVPFWTK